MKGAKAVIASFVLLVFVSSSTMGAVTVQAISWGQPDTSNTYANVGAVVYEHLFYEEYRLLCSGTLVYEGDGDNGGAVFLTAAHCTDYLLWKQDEGIIGAVYVSFDPVDPFDGASWHPVTDIISYLEYNPTTNPPDLGILILDGEVDGIAPATLPEEGFLDDLWREKELRPKGSTGADFTVAGYGGVLTWPPPAITYPDTRSWALSQFQALRKTQLILSQNNAKTSEGGTCFGDSGGPVFWESTGISTLVAVTSWGDAMCVAMGAYCRIDTAEALDFIYEYLP